MGKTRDLFKEIRHTKGTFHAKMGLIKDRNGMDLTEAEIHEDSETDSKTARGDTHTHTRTHTHT